MAAALLRRIAVRRLARALASDAARRGPDHFALLNAERRYDLCEQQLTRSYKLLMGEAHPDRHGNSSEAERLAAADHAAAITDAYSILRAPHQRAVHLLDLLGAPLDEETNSDVLGPAFLMQVMEAREELEDAAADPTRLQALREANTAAVGALHGDLVAAFAGLDLERARALTAQLQYLQRIEEEIHERMPVT